MWWTQDLAWFLQVGGRDKEVVKENHHPVRHPVGQPFYLPDVLMMIVWGP
jgi:hypothetical protein